ncbi:uncharacterized protein TNCV_3853331 [Trichonephila clavipes]|nr:uncharacterized protein TNCV_3853331 [Trichonephila clavipes]
MIPDMLDWRHICGSDRPGRVVTVQRQSYDTLAVHLHMVREETGVPKEDSACLWMVADKEVGCRCAFLTIWWSSRRLVCRGRPEPGLRVNHISRIHWSQHLLTTQREWPN